MGQRETIFLDVEASGLHRGSYPIEVGWAYCDLTCSGFLIRPAPHWGEEDWSVQAERIHGITRAECLRDGVDVEEAAHRLNSALAGRTLLSDAPEFDAAWLARLYDAARAEPAFPLRLVDAMEPIKSALADRGLDARDLEALERRVKARWPRAHRAAADAVYLAALYRAAQDPDFLGSGQ